MHRRKFYKLMAADTGYATSLALASYLTQSAEIDSSTSFPVSDRQAVVKEGWGTSGDSGGPGMWDGVPKSLSRWNGPSLLDYETPEWYCDAKFCIRTHWSPQFRKTATIMPVTCTFGSKRCIKNCRDGQVWPSATRRKNQ